MKRFIILICFGFIILSFISCSSCSSCNVKEVFDGIVQSSESASAPFVSNVNYAYDYDNSNFSDSKEYIVYDGAPQSYTFEIDGIAYNVKYTGKSYQPKISSKNFTDLSVVTDKYVSQNSDPASKDGAEISVDRKTGRIVELRRLDTMEKRKEVGYLTVEQIQEKADQIANSLYGEEVMSQYTMFKELVNNGMNADGTGHVSVLYKRKVFGYYTDDTIMFTFNRKGDLISIRNDEKMDLYKDVEEKLTKEEVEAAEKYLVEEMTQKGYWIGSRTLCVGADGKYYLSLLIERPAGQNSPVTILQDVYVNIK